jgi:hypothetical protein
MTIQVACRYQPYLWGTDLCCVVDSFDLSSANKMKNLVFDGSIEQKSNTIGIKSANCGNIDFIPHGIYQQFKNIKRITISNSNLPIINAELFSSGFENVEWLDLSKNNIQEIEANAFVGLKDIKQIHLSGNKITALKNEIFKNNTKLEYIDFKENEIEMINPKIFKSLNSMTKVNINNLSLTVQEAKAENGNLKSCFKHYSSVEKITSENIRILEKLKFVSNKYKLCIKQIHEVRSNFDNKWNIVEKNTKVIKENFKIIRESYLFTDVTFELGDNQIIEAHRHILEGEYSALY